MRLMEAIARSISYSGLRVCQRTRSKSQAALPNPFTEDPIGRTVTCGNNPARASSICLAVRKLSLESRSFSDVAQ